MGLKKEGTGKKCHQIPPIINAHWSYFPLTNDTMEIVNYLADAAGCTKNDLIKSAVRIWDTIINKSEGNDVTIVVKNGRIRSVTVNSECESCGTTRPKGKGAGCP